MHVHLINNAGDGPPEYGNVDGPEQESTANPSRDLISGDSVYSPSAPTDLLKVKQRSVQQLRGQCAAEAAQIAAEYSKLRGSHRTELGLSTCLYHRPADAGEVINAVTVHSVAPPVSSQTGEDQRTQDSCVTWQGRLSAFDLPLRRFAVMAYTPHGWDSG
ncbi:hypothetical protein C8R44DRAFT_741746 [Mycena epipterygia]|nr:hypothetical protein C8R44DRAFT_741746 [Mycena epipterygia]